MDEKTAEQPTSERINQETNSKVEVIDPVQVHFGWRIPVQRERITFQTRISHKGQTSAVDFEINPDKLSGIELQQLCDFLTRRHAGLVSGYEVTRVITWLLDISIAQTQPGLSKAERDSKVRELLLSTQADNK